MLFAQVGLSAPAGGALVLIAVAALALVGLILSIVFGINLFRAGPSRTRDIALVIVGLVLASPAVVLTAVVFRDVIPRKKSWDLSASRSVALLGEEEDEDVTAEERERIGYTYSGNIRSLVKIDSTRQWSGDASSVYFQFRSGTIHTVNWQARQAELPRVYERTRAILNGLAMDSASQQRLDAWYAGAQRGEQPSFVAETAFAPKAKLHVQLLPVLRSPRWITAVRVSWDEP